MGEYLVRDVKSIAYIVISQTDLIFELTYPLAPCYLLYPPTICGLVMVFQCLQ